MEYTLAYRKKHSWLHRLSQAHKLTVDHPGHVPIIVDRNNVYTQAPKHHRFLVCTEYTMGQLLKLIRNDMESLDASQALIISIWNEDGSGMILPPLSLLVGDVYFQHKDGDNFLYLTVSIESTFG
jgi:hypothetical protein